MAHQIKHSRPQPLRNRPAIALWGSCLAGLVSLALMQRSPHVEHLVLAATLLSGMLACTRTSMAGQRKTGENVTETLDHRRQLDEAIARRVIGVAVQEVVQQLVDSGQITIVAKPGTQTGLDDTALWRPSYYDNLHLAAVVPIQSRARASEAS